MTITCLKCSSVLCTAYAVVVLSVFLFVQVKAENFVQQEKLAQRMCEVTVSLTLYPPAPTSALNDTFVTLRQIVKGYFAIPNNRLHQKEDFEQELSRISLELPKESPTDGSLCEKVSDTDSHVYSVLKWPFATDAAVASYCRKAIAVGKKRGQNGEESVAFAASNFADHFANIVAGISFAYTFCDARNAVGSIPLADSAQSSLSLENVCSEWAKGFQYTSDISPDLLDYLDPSGRLREMNAVLAIFSVLGFLKTLQVSATVFAGVWKLEEQTSIGNKSTHLADAAYHAELSRDIDLNGTRFSTDTATQVRYSVAPLY